jgi:hypothetical protein
MEITNLDDLSRLISDDSVSKEIKLRVFLEALKGYPVRIMTICNNGGKNLVDDPNDALVPNMLRVLNEIKSDSSKDFYSGFMIILK